MYTHCTRYAYDQATIYAGLASTWDSCVALGEQQTQLMGSLQLFISFDRGTTQEERPLLSFKHILLLVVLLLIILVVYRCYHYHYQSWDRWPVNKPSARVHRTNFVL